MVRSTTGSVIFSGTPWARQVLATHRATTSSTDTGTHPAHCAQIAGGPAHSSVSADDHTLAGSIPKMPEA